MLSESQRRARHIAWSYWGGATALQCNRIARALDYSSIMTYNVELDPVLYFPSYHL